MSSTFKSTVFNPV